MPEITASKKPEIEDWPSKCGTFNPCRHYGARSGLMLNTAIFLRRLLTVDIDVDDREAVLGIMDLVFDQLATPTCIRFCPGSDRLALLFRCNDADGLYRGASGSDGAVEIFCGERSKLSSFGIHTHKETGVQTRYCWEQVPGNVGRSDLTEVTVGQGRCAFSEAKRPVIPIHSGH